MLEQYNEKRDFNKTREPQGKPSKSVNKAGRFVVQYHEARAKHYDFRLEHNGVLLSWAVPKGLSNNPKDKRLAVHVEDHPVDYIDFQGTIPKGEYGGGTVEIFDNGVFAPLEDIDDGIEKGIIKVVLNGRKLKGSWNLVKAKENNWFIIKGQDSYAEN